jgi:hypothetical protein
MPLRSLKKSRSEVPGQSCRALPGPENGEDGPKSDVRWVLGYGRVPSCGTPWLQPRNPTRDISPKGLILHAKCSLERRFFVQHHKDMTGKPEQRAVPEETHIAEQKRFTQNDTNDRDIHWISHVAIKAVTTSFCVGAIGAGVPSPSSAKRPEGSRPEQRGKARRLTVTLRICRQGGPIDMAPPAPAPLRWHHAGPCHQ